MNPIVVSNNAIKTFLSKFREEQSSVYDCNIYVENMSFFLAGEISNYLKNKNIIIKTPLGVKECTIIDEDIILVPIMRAGFSMLSGFQRILPQSKTGIICAHRDHNGTAHIDTYKLPDQISNKTIIILDTMLATGNTINASAALLEQYSPKTIICASIIATKTGLNNLSKKIEYAFFVDNSDSLDENLYVFPGVGDSGDRLFG